MKFFGQERRAGSKRTDVAWRATLHWNFGDLQGVLPVRVISISPDGARLVLETMMVCGRHLFVYDFKPNLRLEFTLPEDQVLCPPVAIQWYAFQEEGRVFHVGVHFLQMEEHERTAWRQFLKFLDKLG